MKRILSAVVIAFFAAAPLLAGDGDAILGVWATDPEGEGGQAHIEIGVVDGKYSGKIVWLEEQLAQATSIARASENFGIFGTSISATWLFGALEAHVSFFVDEDEGRIGRAHMGKPIVSPADIPSGADVYVPLLPHISSAVSCRLQSDRVRLHVTPELVTHSA